MAAYTIKWFLTFTLTLLAAAIVLGDVQTAYADWIMILWVALIGERLLEKPIATLWKRR